MNIYLRDVIRSAEKLPDQDQEELAAQIEGMIMHREIALAEVDIATGNVRPVTVVRADLRARYGS